MLEDVELVDWAGLDAACREPQQVATLLRDLGSADAETVMGALGEAHSMLLHQGTVYTASAAAVPFLVELAAGAPHHRAEILGFVGALADPSVAQTGPCDLVTRAVAAQAPAIGHLLLTAADPPVRSAAAYAYARAGGPPDVLWQAWQREDNAAVRASVLLALAATDPQDTPAVLAEAVVGDVPDVRLAAGLALAAGSGPWPDGAVEGVASALEAGARVDDNWSRRDWGRALLVPAADEDAVALVRRLLHSPVATLRRDTLYGVMSRMDASRRAPDLLLPLISVTLDDPDPKVRGTAWNVLHQAGRAAGQYASRLADNAARWPHAPSTRGGASPLAAIRTLARLGDPRWLDPFCGWVAAGGDGPVEMVPPPVTPCTPQVLDAVRQRLADWAAAGQSHRALPDLCRLLSRWGDTAAAAVPQLRAVLPLSPGPAAAALVALDAADADTVPYLRVLCDGTSDVRAATALWQLTTDPTALLHAVSASLSDGRNTWDGRAATAGTALAPVLPQAQHLLGAAAGTTDDRRRQVVACWVGLAVTGTADHLLPTIQAILQTPHRPSARHDEAVAAAADFVAYAADRLTPAPTGLSDTLDSLLAAHLCTVHVARALWRLGVQPANLVLPLVQAYEWGQNADGAGRLLVAMGAVDALPELDRLTDQDERSWTFGRVDTIVWEDERLRDSLRATTDRLRGPI